MVAGIDISKDTFDVEIKYGKTFEFGNAHQMRFCDKLIRGLGTRRIETRC